MNTKRIIGLTLGGMIVLLSACNQKYKDKIEALQADSMKKSLAAHQHEKRMMDSLNHELSLTLLDIKREMNEVLRDEGIMVRDDDAFTESAMDTREEIKKRISNVDEILKHNRQRIVQLITRLEKSEYRNADLEKALAETRNRLEANEKTMEELFISLEDERIKYERLDAGLRQMVAQNDSLGQTVQKLDEQVHTAYFAVGSFRDLKDKGVLTREGGILTIGSTHALEDDFSESEFQQIDIRKDQRIIVGTEKAELVTEHPSDSYTFEYQDDLVAYLEITNPEEFWKASKYMVLQTK